MRFAEQQRLLDFWAYEYSDARNKKIYHLILRKRAVKRYVDGKNSADSFVEKVFENGEKKNLAAVDLCILSDFCWKKNKSC